MACAAMERGDALAALDALKEMERRVGEARTAVKAELRRLKPRGARLVVLHGRRQEAP